MVNRDNINLTGSTFSETLSLTSSEIERSLKELWNLSAAFSETGNFFVADKLAGVDNRISQLLTDLRDAYRKHIDNELHDIAVGQAKVLDALLSNGESK
jgi:hypothetical protein